MNIILQNIGKRFNYSWIFREVNHTFETDKHYGITGFNGSGKSTLLKVIGGILTPSEGKITWNLIPGMNKDELYRFIGISSPHSTLIEEFTLRECIGFHSQFKPFIGDLSTPKILDIIGLKRNSDKPIRHFSSGMKQRVKIALTILSANKLIILDEPCTNLDSHSTFWFQNLVNDFAMGRLAIIGSNQPQDECKSCSEFIDLSQ